MLTPLGRLTLTLAVALSWVPVNAPLIAVTAVPLAGLTLKVMTLSSGTPVVAKVTATGFVVSAGNVISALPVGATGAVTPAMLVILREGKPATKTLSGLPKE